MTIESAVTWYDKNVNYKLTRAFLEFLIKTGIVKSEINIEMLNSFLLEAYGDEFVKVNGRFKIKENRIPVIEKYNDVKKEEKKPSTKQDVKNRIEKVTKAKPTEKKKPVTKFKIESLGGKKLKLVKL